MNVEREEENTLLGDNSDIETGQDTLDSSFVVNLFYLQEETV